MLGRGPAIDISHNAEPAGAGRAKESRIIELAQRYQFDAIAAFLSHRQEQRDQFLSRRKCCDYTRRARDAHVTRLRQVSHALYQRATTNVTTMMMMQAHALSPHDSIAIAARRFPPPASLISFSFDYSLFEIMPQASGATFSLRGIARRPARELFADCQ